jgi:serine protease Do
MKRYARISSLTKVSIISTVLSVFALALPAPAASKALETARHLNQAFVEVADTVSQSVVVIQVTFKATSKPGDGESNSWLERLPDWFKDEFMPDPGEGAPDDSEESPTPRGRRGFEIPQPEGSGSGVIIREDGYILTNAHVVKDAAEIKVRLKDGREFDAEVRGIDDLSEVAVIKLKGEGLKDLPTVKFANSDKVRVGEFAIAIGAPFSLDYTCLLYTSDAADDM